ncbi:MAG: hypothetical protein WD178_11475 [Actinomycetota bacterium]
MDGVTGGGLFKEVRETFLLLGISAGVLGGYLGLALVLFRAAG